MSKISVLSHFQETDVLTSFWYVETTDTIEFHISRCFETFVELSVLSKQWYGETTVLPHAHGKSFPKRTYSADWVLIVFRNQRWKRVFNDLPIFTHVPIPLRLYSASFRQQVASFEFKFGNSNVIFEPRKEKLAVFNRSGVKQ